MNTKIATRTLIVSALLAGCGELDESDVSETQSAFSEASCTTATADATYANGVVPSYVSPTTYDNPRCNKSVVVDILPLSSWYVGPPSGGAVEDGQTEVEWNASLPTTQSGCTNLWLGAILYRRSGGAWVQQKLVEDNGTWALEPISQTFRCSGPSVAFHTTNNATWGFTADMIAGRNYRIAATARTVGSSAAPTRSLRITSRQPEVIQ